MSIDVNINKEIWMKFGKRIEFIARYEGVE
jgi:hypothetical protein